MDILNNYQMILLSILFYFILVILNIQGKISSFSIFYKTLSPSAEPFDFTLQRTEHIFSALKKIEEILIIVVATPLYSRQFPCAVFIRRFSHDIKLFRRCARGFGGLKFSSRFLISFFV